MISTQSSESLPDSLSDDISIGSIDSQSSQNRFRSSRTRRNSSEENNLPEDNNLLYSDILTNTSSNSQACSPSDEISIGSFGSQSSQNRLRSSRIRRNLSEDNNLLSSDILTNTSTNSQESNENNDIVPKKGRKKKQNNRSSNILVLNDNDNNNNKRSTRGRNSEFTNSDDNDFYNSPVVKNTRSRTINKPYIYTRQPRNSNNVGKKVSFNNDLTTNDDFMHNFVNQIMTETNITNDNNHVHRQVLLEQIQPAKTIEGVSPYTNIIDLDFEQFGCLIGIQNSLRAIPNQCLSDIRVYLIDLLEKIMEFPNNLLNHKKFILLPTVLFTSLDGSSAERVREIKNRLHVLKNDNWDLFTLSYFQSRKSNNHHNNFSQNNDNNIMNDEVPMHHKEAINQIKLGNLSKGMQKLNNNRIPITFDENYFNNLLSKFPTETFSDLTEEEQHWLDNFVMPDDINPYDYSYQRLCKKLNNVDISTAPGIDKWRYYHLKQLIGSTKVEATDKEFRLGELLCWYICGIANATLPQEVMNYYGDCELLGIPKTVTDNRPIGKGSVFRKLGASIIHEDNKSFNINYFADLQFGFESSGMDKIIHSFRAFFNYSDDFDKFAMDGVNAFNSCARNRMLFEIAKNRPRSYPHCKAIYGRVSNMWIFGFQDYIRKIPSGVGVHQGCVVANWCFSMSCYPFFKKLQSILTVTNGISMFYIDDGNSKSKPEATIEVIKYIKDNGKYYGYELNMAKGSLCMAKFSTNELAKQHYNALVSVGINPDIIHYHPNNVSAEEEYQARLQYGMKVLGVNIGDDMYINNKMDSYINDLKEKANNLINFKRNQDKFLLLQYCYVPLIDHYLRTTSPFLTVQLCQTFDILKKSILLSCLSHKVIDNDRWTQARLPINKSGLGMRFSHTVRNTAFVASVITSYETVKKSLPHINYLDETDDFFKSFRTAVKSIMLCQNRGIDNNNYHAINNNDNNNNNNNNEVSLETIMKLKSNKNNKRFHFNKF